MQKLIKIAHKISSTLATQL